MVIHLQIKFLSTVDYWLQGSSGNCHLFLILQKSEGLFSHGFLVSPGSPLIFFFFCACTQPKHHLLHRPSRAPKLWSDDDDGDVTSRRGGVR